MKETNELRKIFSENLKYWTEVNVKTMSDVARDLKISFSTVADWYSGKNYPRIEALQKLADYFGIKKADLIERNIGINNTKKAIKTLYIDFTFFENELRKLKTIDDIDVIHSKIKELLGEKE